MREAQPAGLLPRFDAGSTSRSVPSSRTKPLPEVSLFHPGGRLMFTTGWDNAVRAWDVPTAAVGDVERLVLWTQVLTGMELGPDGSARDLDDEAWQQRRLRLDRLGGPPPRP